MNKTKIALLCLLALVPTARAAETPASEATPAAAPTEAKSLEDQLQALGTPGNQAPAGLTSEKLYAVQNRFSSLRRRHELTLGGGSNFSASGFLSSRNLDSTYRFYLSERWYLGLSGSVVFNEFTKDGQYLVDTVDRPADVGVTKFRSDLQLGYNLFYGKFRASMDQVFYFDQYVALGPGMIWMQGGRRVAAVADVGFAFWFGRNFSFRLGLKDYFFDEQRYVSHGLVHDFVGYFQAGYVFGG